MELDNSGKNGAEDENLLLTCEDEAFDLIIQELSSEELLDTISNLHEKTSFVQQKMNSLQERIRSISPPPAIDNSADHYNNQISELKKCQDTLTKLINKSMKCFAQHKQRKLQDQDLECSQKTAPPKEKPKAEVNPVKKPSESVGTKTTIFSKDKTNPLKSDSSKDQSLRTVSEHQESVREPALPSNGTTNEEFGKRASSPVLIKSANVLAESRKEKPGGRKLIQEFSVKTPMDDIRAEIFRNVDKTAKENVSKLLVNNVAHFHNKDVKLHTKGDILAFKSEVESQVATKNTLKPKKKEDKATVPNNFKDTKPIPIIKVNNEASIKKLSTDESVPNNFKDTKTIPIIKINDEASIKELSPDEVPPDPSRNHESKEPAVMEKKLHALSDLKDDFSGGMAISVTEVTISSSSTDRSPDLKPRSTDPAYFRQLSGNRVEPMERISNRNMQESASMLEKFFQGMKGSGGGSSGTTVKNFVIRKSKGNENWETKSRVTEGKPKMDGVVSNHDQGRSIGASIPEEDEEVAENRARDSMTEENNKGNKAKDPNSIQSPDEGEKTEPAAAGAGAAPLAPLRIPVPQEENEEPIKERVYLRSWDPTPLLKELYAIRLMDDNTEDLSHHFIEMEGLMEKLPMNKKKATLLKTWKRRYFHAKNGWLIYYDNRNDEKPSDEVLLMGGEIHVIGNQVIGIDDGRGRYLMVRCPSQKEYNLWLTSLQSQTTDNTRATYVRPEIDVPKNPDKKVVMIEFGSLSIRAGILREKPSLPQLFFPNIVALHQEGNVVKHVIGFDAYKPEIRHSSQLVQPFGPTDKVDKFKIDFETLPSVFSAIFKDLKIASEEYYVMLILPVNIRDEDKSMLMDILIKQFRVCGVCMAPQALLALYSYNAQSGIVVDIGERIEVLPIYEGFVIDGGHAVKPFGAPKIRQTLRSGLTSENYPLYSPLEQLLVRLVMEQTCFVSKNFNEDCQQFQRNPEKFQETIYLKKYDLPEDTYTSICHSLSRFVSPEGLFNMDLWGMDYPTIQSLVKNAIEACPMDNRRHLCRSIYLSGGVTLLPGFAQRLESELQKHLNETLVIQVHSSPQRYHAAYIGACALGLLSEFESSCVTSEEWEKEGTKAFQKWKMTS